MQAFPKYVDIDTINTCNARCTMCGIDFDHRTDRRMDQALFDKIVDELAQRRDDVERVGLAVNCEPLMDRSLHEKVAQLRAAGIDRTFIFTNGSLLSERRTTELIEAGLDCVYVSIDSIDPERYEAIRAGLRFETVYANTLRLLEIKAALRPRTTVRIAMVEQPDRPGEGDAFVEHWKPLLGPGDQVSVTRAYNWGIAQSVVDCDDGVRAAVNRVPCLGLWTSLVVDVGGEVRMCCADEAGVTEVGNLSEQSIAEVWGGPAMSAIRQRHLDGRRHELALCDGCPVWDADKHRLRYDAPSVPDAS